MREDDTENYVANLIAGVIKLIKTLPDGRQQIIGLLLPTEFLGQPFTETSRYTAVTLTEVELCSYRKPQFETLMREFPELEHKLFMQVLADFDRARDWMVLLGRMSAAERVSRALIMIAYRTHRVQCTPTGTKAPVRIELPLSRAELADFLGLTAETVSRELTKLRAQGIIETERAHTIVIPKLERLAAAALSEVT